MNISMKAKIKLGNEKTTYKNVNRITNFLIICPVYYYQNYDH